MNQISNLNEFVVIAQKKFPSFVIWSFVLMGPYSSYLKQLKETKTFHHIEIVNNKIHRCLLYPDCPCHSSSTNKNKDKLKFIKPECCKLLWVRYKFQCEKGGTTIMVLPAICKKYFLYIIFCMHIFLKYVSNDQNILC